MNKFLFIFALFSTFLFSQNKETKILKFLQEKDNITTKMLRSLKLKGIKKERIFTIFDEYKVQECQVKKEIPLSSEQNQQILKLRKDKFNDITYLLNYDEKEKLRGLMIIYNSKIDVKIKNLSKD